MRDLFSKLMTASMVAGAALLVSACGGSESTDDTNVATTEMNSADMMEGTVNDVTAIDEANGVDANMTMDANLSTDMNATMEADNATNAM